ncbi:MAG: MoaD/ThiS family protein [Dehalococcoidia bacterium]|nr:MoaD/ThiS family protein [Dehalococcoidia bacterium]
MPEAKRPTVDEVLAGAVHTIENQLLPNLEDTWARAAASQLMGTLEYARGLIAGDEHVDARVDAVEAVIAGLLRNHPGLEAVLEGSEGETRGFTVLDQASRLLSHAVANDSAEADAIREQLRPLIVQQATDTLNETMPMLMAFGGRPRRVER